MNKHIKIGPFLASVSVAAIFAPAALPAFAQDTGQAADDYAGIEEIIVVSRRREESLKDVPATVSVLTESVLESAGVERAEDFIRMTPGVSMVDAAEVGDTQVNIRGINGARDAENSFAFIVDGVLMTNPAAFNREFADLQQIEILKGPQGALYGRNAAAGAIIVTTKKPGNDMEAKGKISFGTHDTKYVSGSLSGPLVEDEMFFSAHFDWRDTDGFYQNDISGANDVDRFESYNVSGRLLWEPNPATSLDIKSRYGKVDASAITFNSVFALENFANATGNPAAYAEVNGHDFLFQNNITSDNNQDAFEISAKLDHDMEWAELTGWLLYSDIKNDLIADGTSGAFGFFASDPACQASLNDARNAGVVLPAPTFLGATPNPVLVDVFNGSFLGAYTPTTCDGIQEQLRNQSDISLELRLTSPSGQALRWQVGTYMLDINREVGVSLNRDDGGEPVRGLFQRAADSDNFTEALLWDDFDSRVFAIFGNVGYDITETIELSLALRYDNEKRKVTNLVPTDVVTQYVDFDGDFVPGGSPLNPALLFNPGGVPPQEETFEQLQPKASLSWDATDDLTMFASWGKGFKAGGFNNAGSAATINGFINGLTVPFNPANAPVTITDRFDKETSSAFEAGFKGRFLDGRLTFDGAIYHTTVTDMQSFEFFVGPFGLLRVVNNIDEVKLKGLELGATARVHEYFTISGGFSVVDSEITAFASRPDTIGNKSPYTPDYTANLAAQFNYPVNDNVEFMARADIQWVGKTWFHAVQDQTRQSINGAFIAIPGFFCDQLTGIGFQPPECDAPDNGASLGLANYALTQRDAYSTIDIRFGFETETWAVMAFAKNLTKNRYLEEVIPAPEFGGSFIHPGALRTWGVEASFRY